VRRISFPARFNLGYQLMRGIGLREAILLTLAAGQAMWLVFIFEGLHLATRVMLATIIAILLITLATVPVRGYKIEQYLIIMLRGSLRPKVYLHQTAQGMSYQVNEDVVVQPVEEEKPVRDVKPRREIGYGEWAAPNVLAVMAMFLALMVVSALLLYVLSDGELPGLHAVGGGMAW
jgi:hypothetical protein